MLQRRLFPGRQVSVLSIGSWQTVERARFEDTVEILARAYAQGVNFFDTARYAHVPPDARGEAQAIPPGSPFTEVIFGRALQLAGIPRAGYVLSEKVWYDRYPAQSFAEQLDASMRRLGVEHVDLVFCQVPQPGLNVLQLAREMASLVASGRSGSWGVVNWSPAQMRAAHEAAAREGFTPPAVMEIKYSAIRRLPAESADHQAVCSELGMTIHASNTLEGGLLTGRVTDLREFAARRILPEDTLGVREAFVPRRHEFLTAAEEFGLSPAQLALAFAMANPHVCSVLVGMTRPEQLDDNVQAVAALQRIGVAALRERLAGFAERAR